MVVGSRFAGPASYRSPFAGRLGIALFARIVSMLVRQRVTDPTSGFRAVNRRALELFAGDYPHDYPEVEATVLVAPAAAAPRRGAGRDARTGERHARRSAASARSYYMAKVLLALFVGLFRATRRRRA